MDDHAQRLADSLWQHNIKHVFGVTGSGSSLKLIERLQALGANYYPVAHEGAGALMAGACSDGKVRGLSISIKGPGYINLAAGILANRYEGRATLSVSEAYNTDAPASRAHKRLDHGAITSAVAKAYAKYDGSDSQIESLTTIAQEEYPGPVHIDLCAQPEYDQQVYAGKDDGSMSSTEGELAQALKQIAASEKPMIILGSLAARRRLEAIWNRLQVPCFTTAAAKGAVNETGLFAGGVITGEIARLAPENSAAYKSADLVIGVGLRHSEVIKSALPDVPYVSIDEIPSTCAQGFVPSTTVRSRHIQRVCEVVEDGLRGKSWGDAEIGAHRKQISEAILTSEWLPGPIYQRVQQLVGDDAVLVLDTGFFCTVGEVVWKTQRPDDFRGSSVGRFMGTGIPTAIGAAIASRRRVVCVVGDGGISPHFSELKLAIEEQLPILVLLFSDGRFGSVSSFVESSEFVRRAVDVRHASWWRAVEALGCPARKIDGWGELENVLSVWEQEPLFLEFDFEPTRYAEAARLLR